MSSFISYNSGLNNLQVTSEQIPYYEEADVSYDLAILTLHFKIPQGVPGLNATTEDGNTGIEDIT